MLKAAAATPATRRAVALPPDNCRTRVGTGKQTFLGDVDERSIVARRFREVYAQIVSDIGGDPSEAQTQLARRAATLSVWAESIEAQLAQGADIDAPEFATVANALRRLFADLGIERVARDISPPLDAYLKRKHPPARGVTA
jgi:hypothetical protein